MWSPCDQLGHGRNSMYVCLHVWPQNQPVIRTIITNSLIAITTHNPKASWRNARPWLTCLQVYVCLLPMYSQQHTHIQLLYQLPGDRRTWKSVDTLPIKPKTKAVHYPTEFLTLWNLQAHISPHSLPLGRLGHSSCYSAIWNHYVCAMPQDRLSNNQCHHVIEATILSGQDWQGRECSHTMNPDNYIWYALLVQMTAISN